MLSALPKLADKAFIFGFFLPVLLLSFTCLILFSDEPSFSNLVQAALEKEHFEKLVYLTLTVWILSVLLLMFNHIQYQILEGYLWPLNRFETLKIRERDRFLSIKVPFDELTGEWRKMGSSFPAEKRKECDNLERELAKNFPMKEEHLLATRFGNAIRAFETYSSYVYGADGVSLWPHLSTVMSKEMKSELADARAQVDFLVNMCCFAALVGLIAIVRLIMHVTTLNAPWVDCTKLISPTSLFFGAFIAGSAVVCAMTYHWSIQQVYIWGAIVKAAFDCYLPALALKLGYRLTNTESEQKKFWKSVSEVVIYHRSMPSGRWPRIQEKNEQQELAASEGNALAETKEADEDNDPDNDVSADLPR
jgi:hypothetical protein